MRSKVSEEVRSEQFGQMLQLSPEERVRVAFELGISSLEDFAATEGISTSEAKRRLRSVAVAGRRFSKCMSDLDAER